MKLKTVKIQSHLTTNVNSALIKLNNVVFTVYISKQDCNCKEMQPSTDGGGRTLKNHSYATPSEVSVIYWTLKDGCRLKETFFWCVLRLRQISLLTAFFVAQKVQFNFGKERHMPQRSCWGDQAKVLRWTDSSGLSPEQIKMPVKTSIMDWPAPLAAVLKAGQCA